VTLFIGTSLRSKGIGLEITTQQTVMAKGNSNEFIQAIVNILLSCKEALTKYSLDKPLITIKYIENSGRPIVTIRTNCQHTREEYQQRANASCHAPMNRSTQTAYGLELSKSIIENRLGGRLTVIDVENGTEFRIELEPAS
jgi:C4-dicarboxylate-specific signal transduction histidine kinase